MPLQGMFSSQLTSDTSLLLQWKITLAKIAQAGKIFKG